MDETFLREADLVVNIRPKGKKKPHTMRDNGRNSRAVMQSPNERTATDGVGISAFNADGIDGGMLDTIRRNTKKNCGIASRKMNIEGKV